MLRSSIFCILILMASASLAQSPVSITRNSSVSLTLKKKEKRAFKINLIQHDVISFNLKVIKGINFRFIDAEGQIIIESLVKKNTFTWEKEIKIDGVYSIEFENTSLFLPSVFIATIALQRPNFIYGPGDPAVDPAIVKLAERNQMVLSGARFQITQPNPKEYKFPFEKGDTLQFQLIPILANSPFVEITNDLNEIVFASLPGKRELNVTIPVLEKGVYTISMVSESFLKSNPFRGKIDSLRIEKISPAKYGKPDAAQSDNPALLNLDTIAEVFIDTVIYLGAIRDIIHPSKQRLNVQVQEANEILFWGILFGSGQSFTKEVDQFQPLLQGDALASGATDVLSAYGLGYLKKMPGPGNKDVTFTPSKNIKDHLLNGPGSNYALIYGKGISDYLQFENESKSVGHNVYVKVVLFKSALKGP